MAPENEHKLFLLKHGATEIDAVERLVFGQRLGDLLIRSARRYREPSKPPQTSGIASRHVEHGFRAWLFPRGVVINDAQPLFSSTIGRIAPGRWVGQRPLGKHHPGNASTHEAVKPVRSRRFAMCCPT